MITQDNFDTDFRDPVEEYQIDKFVCDEMSRQLHRYIKAMKGSHSHMLRFEERLRQQPQPERIQAIARYIDLNRHAIDGLDWKIVVVRAIANYSDTYSYFNKLLTNKERFEYYTDKIRSDLRTPYIYVDDLVSVPIIAQRNGKMGLLLADGKDTVVSPFIYDDIAVSEEPPYFEAVIDGHRGHLSIDGVFTKE